MQVVIEVENQNDVAPVFDKPSYAKSMEEGYRSSTPILQVGEMVNRRYSKQFLLS